jgi:hypothetical protein
MNPIIGWLKDGPWIYHSGTAVATRSYTAACSLLKILFAKKNDRRCAVVLLLSSTAHLAAPEARRG